MSNQFEIAGDMADWPRNVPGKRTKGAVFGVMHSTDSKRQWEILWTGDFPDLEPAQYWGAKKEAEAIRKGKWMMASRVLWQHDLSPDDAVAGARRSMEPQVKRAMGSMATGGNIEFGDGPMRPVDGRDHPRYLEIASAETDEVLGSFIIPPDSEIEKEEGYEDDDDGMIWHTN